MNKIECNYKKGVPKRAPILKTLFALVLCLCTLICCVSFNNDKKVVSASSTSINLVNNDDFEMGDITSSGTVESSSDVYARTRHFIKVTPNIPYTFNVFNTGSLELIGVKVYTSKDLSTGSRWGDIKSFPSTITFDSGINFIRLVIKPVDTSVLNDKQIQLEEGSVSTDYVPYNSNNFISNTLLLPLTLSTSNSAIESFSVNYCDSAYFYFTLDINSNNEVTSLTFYLNSTFVYADYYTYQGWNKITISTIYDLDSDYLDNSWWWVFNNYIKIKTGYVVYAPIRSSFPKMSVYSEDSTKMVPIVDDISYVTIKGGSSQGYKRTALDYYNSSGNIVFSTSLFCPSSSVEIDTRTYYFKDIDFTDNEYYNQGFTAGESQGYNNGYSVGEDVGYDSGYSIGYDDGLIIGRNDALNETNSFKDLMFAIVDAPFNVFANAFDFTLFGINLSSLLIAIVSVALVAVVIKKLL